MLKVVNSTENRKRGTVLNLALDIINGERQDAYGNPEDNFSTIARLWSDYLGGKYKMGLVLSRVDVALMMTLLKIARLSTGTAKSDSYADAAGYIGLASDMVEYE